MAAIAGAPHASVLWWAELERWVNPYRALNPRALPKGWALTKVKDVAIQMTAACEVRAGQKYRMVGVKWYGEGTFERETVNGEEISAKHLFLVTPGAFIYNRLFAWKASFAVVPTEHEGCFVSSEFPQFIVDESRANAQYLRLYFSTNKVVRAVEAASVGTAAVSRNRFKEEEFLSFSVPLPPLPVQEAIVAHWRNAQEAAAKSRDTVAALEAEIPLEIYKALGTPHPAPESVLPKLLVLRWKDFERWSFNYIARARKGLLGFTKSCYPIQPLGERLLGTMNGYCIKPVQTQTLHKMLKLSALTPAGLDVQESKFGSSPD